MNAAYSSCKSQLCGDEELQVVLQTTRTSCFILRRQKETRATAEVLPIIPCVPGLFHHHISVQSVCQCVTLAHCCTDFLFPSCQFPNLIGSCLFHSDPVGGADVGVFSPLQSVSTVWFCCSASTGLTGPVSQSVLMGQCESVLLQEGGPLL